MLVLAREIEIFPTFNVENAQKMATRGRLWGSAGSWGDF